MKSLKIVYWVVTGLLSAMMLFASFNYIFKHGLVAEVFVKRGYPTYITYPLAVAKVLGVIAILTKKSGNPERMGLCRILLQFSIGVDCARSSR